MIFPNYSGRTSIEDPGKSQKKIHLMDERIQENDR